jgi:hypothetical protein
MPNSESIRFNGVIFRRYPNSSNWADRQYYTPGIADRQRGIGRLHEEIWKRAHGPIPDGCEIHHADYNPDNNDLRNLVCLTVAEHKEAHRERGRERTRTPEFQAHLNRIRPLAAGWHRSEEGRAWHREHATKHQFGRGKQRAEVCEQCGASYETTKASAGDRFCSNKCKSAWRRASGVDNEQRVCAYCGGEFTVNRYNPKRCCGRTCAQRLRAAEARAGVQPDGG